MRSWKVWLLILLFPLIAIAAYLYCESQNYPGCENKQRRSAEVALSLILLADKEQPKQAASGKRVTQPAQNCPVVCRIVTRTFNDPVVLFTGVICFVLVLQLIWMTRQERVLNRIERPQLFLIFERRDFGPFRDDAASYATTSSSVPPEISYRLHNFGRQVAVLRRMSIAYAFSADAPVPEEVRAPIEQVIPPQSAGENMWVLFPRDWSFSRDQINLLQEGRLFFWFAALVEYADAFGNSYETEVLWRYTMAHGQHYFAPWHEGGRNRNT